MGGNLTKNPWRTFQCKSEQWTQKHLDQLKGAIPEITFPSAQKVTTGKIVLIGPIQSGKSSFINSVISIKKDRIVQKATEGGGGSSITQEHNQFVCSNFLVCDTMGLETRERVGFNIGDIVQLLKGNTPKDYQFDPASPITEETPGFNRDPTNADRVHCVIFCVVATEFLSGIQDEYRRKFHEMQREIRKLRIPLILILTKIDELCVDVQSDIANTFKSKKVQRVVKTASEFFSLPEKYIHPVKNFKHEVYPEIKQSILILIALKQAVEFAQDYIEELSPGTM